MTMLKRLRAQRKMSDRPELTRALIQLKAIASVRNDVVHRGAEFRLPAEGQGASSYMVREAMLEMPRPARQRNVSPDILSAMTFDLRTIAYALMSSREHSGELPTMQALAMTAWHYNAAAVQQ